MTTIKHTIATNLRERREFLRMTQAKLAEQAQVSVELVSRIERGRCLPSVPTLVAFSRALETTPDRLLGLQPKDTPEIRSLLDIAVLLPKQRLREIQRIAEALATYEKKP